MPSFEVLIKVYLSLLDNKSSKDDITNLIKDANNSI